MKLFEPQALIIILVIVMIIFGPKQLPELGKSLGKTMKSFQDGIKDEDDDEADAREGESIQTPGDK